MVKKTAQTLQDVSVKATNLFVPRSILNSWFRLWMMVDMLV
jgi:hypothetical protein